MVDHSFFAMLFAIATALAPPTAQEVGFQNTRHPDQHMTWVRGDDGRWAMTINGRDVGHFQREGDVVVHDPGDQGIERFPIAELLAPEDLRPGTQRIRLTDLFMGALLDVRSDNGTVELHERARRVLVTGLRLETRPALGRQSPSSATRSPPRR